MHKQKLSTLLFIFSVSALLLGILIIQLDTTQAKQTIPPNDEPYTDLYDPDNEPVDFGGGTEEIGTDHISDEQYAAIEVQLQQNIEALGLLDMVNMAETTAVTLSFPLRAASHFDDFGFYSAVNFVDHDPGGGARDYQCGSIVYNGHRGTDYMLWPYEWNKMDNEDVEVIAAAAGTIVYKVDHYPDRSCTWDNKPWNAVYIQHSDGSIAWYGHLKRGSALAKPIGASVAAGEYLGLVGSSGISSAPHLHFELQTAAGQRRDPYAGACNALNTESWWGEQRPYYDSAVNNITIGNAKVQLLSCPLHDITNEQNKFEPGSTVFFTTFYRDQLNTQTSQYTIRRPDNTIFQQWSHTPTETHQSLSWWWSAYTIPKNEQTGTWEFSVAYEGKLYERSFEIAYPVYITVTNPAGGTEWLPGESHTITWENTRSNNVKIDLYKGGVFSTTLTASTPDDGAFDWTIPLSPTLAPDYQIRISDIIIPAIFTDSSHFALGVMEKTYLPVTLKE